MANTNAAEQGTTPYAATCRRASVSCDKAPIRDQSPLYLNYHHINDQEVSTVSLIAGMRWEVALIGGIMQVFGNVKETISL